MRSFSREGAKTEAACACDVTLQSTIRLWLLASVFHPGGDSATHPSATITQGRPIAPLEVSSHRDIHKNGLVVLVQPAPSTQPTTGVSAEIAVVAVVVCGGLEALSCCLLLLQLLDVNTGGGAGVVVHHHSRVEDL